MSDQLHLESPVAQTARLEGGCTELYLVRDVIPVPNRVLGYGPGLTSK